MTERSQNFGVR